MRVHFWQRWFEKMWYEAHSFYFFLLPLSWLFRLLTGLRRYYYCVIRAPLAPKVPVVVVGNVTVGGTGKTPLVLFLAEYFLGQGLNIGIISRGYGGTAESYPVIVRNNTTVAVAGDEPFLMAKRLACPIVVDPNRVRAVETLLEHFPETQVIISDDGLQHYALARTIEIVVLDGVRGVGNAHCLPAGPLRESVERLQGVDLIVIKNAETAALLGPKKLPNDKPVCFMQLVNYGLYRVSDDQVITAQELVELKSQVVYAVAGIGNPEQFFLSLEQESFTIIRRLFPDHYDYQAVDFEMFDAAYPMIMTEKDKVKIESFAKSNWYYLKVRANFSEQDETVLATLLEKVKPLH